MARYVLALFVLSCTIGAAVESDADKNRPVSKVIDTLKEMITQLEKEGEEDEEVYQAMSCWCETNDQEKTAAIAKGERSVDDLTNAIEETTSNSARLNTELENLNKELAKNEAALDSATSLRKKQLEEFNAEEKDMLQSLTSLKGAVVALSKHNSAAFLQGSKGSRAVSDAEAAATIQHQLKSHAALLDEVVTPHQRRILSSYLSLDGDDSALLQEGAAAPQSGEVFGILSSMKETFETNLANAQKEESENNAGYEDLKKAKEEEISTGKDQIDMKTEELADTNQKNADAKQSLEDTRNTLAADTEYLANLKETCKNADQEYEERTKTRQLEIQATSKALSFLSSDEAHDLFTRTFNFLQVSATEGSEQLLRQKLTSVLGKAAKTSRDPRLSTLAMAARTKGFGKVKDTILTMAKNLEKESEDEIKHRDFCIEEINQNEDDTSSKNRDKDDLSSKIEDLTMTLSELTTEIDSLKAAIAEASHQLKIAGEDREKANREFQAVVADQRATQALLAKALDILKGFYNKAALVQTGVAQPAGPPPPGGFKEYKKNESSGGVMGMMQDIIDDAKQMEDEAIRAEEDSQTEYETNVKDTNSELESLNRSLTNKSAIKGKTEAAKVQAEAEFEGVMGDLERLAASSKDLHLSCDYTLKNFDARQAARSDEIEALKQSIAIFSGAKFAAFIENGH